MRTVAPSCSGPADESIGPCRLHPDWVGLSSIGLLFRAAVGIPTSSRPGSILTATHRVVRYDVRFHGRSGSDEVPFYDMADLRTLMDTLRISRATLVGLPMGGRSQWISPSRTRSGPSPSSSWARAFPDIRSEAPARFNEILLGFPEEISARRGTAQKSR